MARYITDILGEFAAQNKQKKIIFPDIDDDRVFQAVSELVSQGESPVICGKEAELERYKQLTDNGLQFFTVPEEEKNEVFAAQKLALGEVDGFLGGNITTTSDIARALIKNVGSAEGIKRASSHFLFGKEGSDVFIYSDGGFQIDPTPQLLAEIALLTTKRALGYGMTPRVAFLSFSTAGSGGQHEKVLKMQEAKTLTEKLFEENDLGDIPIAGEIQFDAALIPEIGMRKDPDTILTQPANIFIFPDLDAANIAYKITERLAGYKALGPILQGFAKPANDLSRGCSTTDITEMYHITKNG